MRSYHNDPKLKAALLAEIRKHREQDQIVQGSYGLMNGDWRGCAIACSLRSLDIVRGNKTRVEYRTHADYETGLGIPKWLALLEDCVFEWLDYEEAILWPEQFAEAVPVGVDLGPLKHRFCSWLMGRNIARVEILNISEELKAEVLAAIRQTKGLHEREEQSESEAWSARSAAESAAESAAGYSEIKSGLLRLLRTEEEVIDKAGGKVEK